MNEFTNNHVPAHYDVLKQAAEQHGFTMSADLETGALLRSLVAAKPSGRFLELGTGAGLSTVWMADGMDRDSYLIAIENDWSLVTMVGHHFVEDDRVEILGADGAEWLLNYVGAPFDLIFADAWPGKYDLLDQTIDLLKIGGFYVIDDMKPQPNWPEGHAEKATNLLQYLDQCPNLVVAKLHWSTGIVIATKVT